jgi:hypothetical protein
MKTGHRLREHILIFLEQKDTVEYRAGIGRPMPRLRNKLVDGCAPINDE